MSIVFAVSSQDQLQAGIPWCSQMARATEMPVHVAVIGADRKVLLKHTQSKLGNELETNSKPAKAELIEETAEALVEFAGSVGCKCLVMIRGTDGKAFQQAAFEKSPFVAIWLRAAGEPPTEREHVFSALSDTQLICGNTMEKFLRLIPAEVIVKEKVDAEDSEAIACAVESVTGGDFDDHDLICVGIKDPDKSDGAYQFALRLFESDNAASVALISDGHTIGETVSRSVSERIKNWVSWVAPPMEREERVMLVDNLVQGSKPNLEFLGLISASAMLAAFGLLQDSAAVIIGAMLIAPLMAPILGAGLSLTHGNRPLFKSSLLTICLGFVGALGASIAFGLLVLMVRPTSANHLDWITPEMWSRCRPSPLDFCVGLVGGIAAAYAQTRKHLSSALAGAAIAAALVPPISTAGLQIAFGIWGNAKGVPEGSLPVVGPLLLVTVNVLTIMIGAAFVLWARGMRSDRETTVKAKWVPRAVAVLLILIAIILVKVVGPDMMFPGDSKSTKTETVVTPD